MNKYNPGDRAYMIESGRFIREVEIIRAAGGMYTVRFIDVVGGVKVREGRLFSTKEKAEAKVMENRKGRTV